MLTPQAQKSIVAVLAANPLRSDEIRRVVGMGELYVSLEKRPSFLFSLTIGGVAYHFHRRHDRDSPNLLRT